jgi:hypothetical protein
MPDVPDRHLGTLHTIHNRGNQPLQKSEVELLIKRGLVEPAGGRGQFGMTHYRLTAAGTEHARDIVLENGKFSHQPGERSPEPAPAPAPSDEVPPGYMRMKNGKVLKIANR